MKKFIMFGLLLGGGLLWAASAQAISLSFSPVEQTVNVGEDVWVDIVISGLGDEIVSAFMLEVSYDSSVLQATGVTFGTELETWFGIPGFSFQGSDISTSGIVAFDELSIIGDDDLAFLQPDHFTLASLHFTAVGVGWSDLTFNPVEISGVLIGIDGIDVKGLQIPDSDPAEAGVLDLTVGTGAIHVAVPEPASLLLFGTGVLGLMGYTWRRRRQTREPQQVS